VAGCDEEVRAGPFLLCITVVHAGPHREGRSGRLYRDGVELVADPGDVVDVDMPDGVVRFTYLGEDRPHLWTVSGWTAEPVAPDA
jgi:hypothetical protein